MRNIAVTLALVAGCLAAPVHADTLDAIVGDYETLANPDAHESGWPDVSPAAAAARYAGYRKLGVRLDALDPKTLTADQALTRGREHPLA